MRFLIISVIFLTSCSSPHRNLSDGEDQNRIPARLEERQTGAEEGAVESQELREEPEERIRAVDPPLFGD